MLRTIIKSRVHSNKHKPKIKQEINNTKSILPHYLLSFKQKLLSGNGFVEYNEYKGVFYFKKLSLEDFQLSDNEPLDTSIINRDFTKIYHRQGDHLNQSDQNIDFIFGENNNYYQIGNAYLEFNITVRKNDTTNFHKGDPLRLVNNAFAFCFKETRLTTSIGGDIEINNFC